MAKAKISFREQEGDVETIVGALRAAGCAVTVERLNGGSYMTVDVPDGLRASLTRNAGAKRRSLPEGSPLEGMTEEEARAWARGRGVGEIAEALGVATSTAYARRRSGRIL